MPRTCTSTGRTSGDGYMGPSAMHVAGLVCLKRSASRSFGGRFSPRTESMEMGSGQAKYLERSSDCAALANHVADVDGRSFRWCWEAITRLP